AERAAHRDAPERARRPAELALDELAVVHAGKLSVCVTRLERASGEGRSMVFAPGGDAADDEEALAGLDEPEPTRLADQLVAGSDRGQSALQLLLLRAQLRDLGLATVQNRARVLVGSERLPVEQGDQGEAGQRQQSRPPQHAADFASWRPAPTRRP